MGKPPRVWGGCFLCCQAGFDCPEGLQVLFRVPGVPAFFLAVPAVTGGFQGGTGLVAGLIGEINLHTVKLWVDLHSPKPTLFHRFNLSLYLIYSSFFLLQGTSTLHRQAPRILHRCSPLRRIITMRRFLFVYHVLIIVIR